MKKLLLLTLLLSVSVYAAFTPFPPSSPPSNAITTKGGLLTSDGAALVEAAACADTEIIEFDSADSKGFKCVAKPSTSQTNYQIETLYLVAYNNGGTATGVTWDFVAVGNTPIIIEPQNLIMKGTLLGATMTAGQYVTLSCRYTLTITTSAPDPVTSQVTNQDMAVTTVADTFPFATAQWALGNHFLENVVDGYTYHITAKVTNFNTNTGSSSNHCIIGTSSSTPRMVIYQL